MKKLVGTARNISFVESEKAGELDSVVECVIMLMEPEYTLSYSDIQRVDRVEAVRFVVGPKALRDVASQFMKWADEAEEALEKVT